MTQNDRYYVECIGCGQVWSPAASSSLWWKAMKRARQGFLGALRVSPQECGCKPAVAQPDARYRVFGYTELCEDFDHPFDSLVAAAKQYRDLALNGMNVVFFVDTTQAENTQSKAGKRLEELYS